MSVTERTEKEEIEFVGPGPYKKIQVQYVLIEENDGVEVSRSTEYKIFDPGTLDDEDNLIQTDLSNEDVEIQELASIHWTDEVRESWKQKLITDKS